MSKVDWSEAPKDATHYVTSGAINRFMKDVTDGGYLFWYKGRWLSGCRAEFIARATPRPAAVKIDLTKLDTPFGELDRDTQLRLVEHVLDGGLVRVMNGDWVNSPSFGCFFFHAGSKYRAAPKVDKYEPTERELEIAELYNKLHDLEAEIDALT